MATSTTAQEVIDRFAGRSPKALRKLEYWRKTKRHVAEVVEKHQSVAVYKITPGDIECVCQRTEHALGDVQKRQIAEVDAIHDWHPDFAFTHLLYRSVEELGELPTYQQFRSFCRDDPVAKKALHDPARHMIRKASARHTRQQAQGAMRWRVGNAYYAFVKELYVLTVLRDAGFSAKVHPLADALFRVDTWVNETNVSLFVSNKTYRSGNTGRKNPAKDILADAKPSFDFVPMELATVHKFGVVHLPSADRILELSNRLNR